MVLNGKHADCPAVLSSIYVAKSPAWFSLQICLTFWNDVTVVVSSEQRAVVLEIFSGRPQHGVAHKSWADCAAYHQCHSLPAHSGCSCAPWPMHTRMRRLLRIPSQKADSRRVLHCANASPAAMQQRLCGPGIGPTRTVAVPSSQQQRCSTSGRQVAAMATTTSSDPQVAAAPSSSNGASSSGAARFLRPHLLKLAPYTPIEVGHPASRLCWACNGCDAVQQAM